MIFVNIQSVVSNSSGSCYIIHMVKHFQVSQCTWVKKQSHVCPAAEQSKTPKKSIAEHTQKTTKSRDEVTGFTESLDAVCRNTPPIVAHSVAYVDYYTWYPTNAWPITPYAANTGINTTGQLFASPTSPHVHPWGTEAPGGIRDTTVINWRKAAIPGPTRE